MNDFFDNNGRQYSGAMVDLKFSGLTKLVKGLAAAQMKTDAKLERVGAPVSEVKERMRAAEAREREGVERMA